MWRYSATAYSSFGFLSRPAYHFFRSSSLDREGQDSKQHKHSGCDPDLIRVLLIRIAMTSMKSPLFPSRPPLPFLSSCFVCSFLNSSFRSGEVITGILRLSAQRPLSTRFLHPKDLHRHQLLNQLRFINRWSERPDCSKINSCRQQECNQ